MSMLKITNKEKILSTATELFIKQGYEKTSVNDIIKKLGVAKGTFYYYFNSKEDLLDEIVKQLAEQIMKPIRKLVAQKNLNALEKLAKIFELSLKYKKAKQKIVRMLVEAIFKSENLLLFQKIKEHNIKLVTPELKKIIEQGKKEKIFKVHDAQEAAEIIVCLQNSYLTSIVSFALDGVLDEEEIKMTQKKLRAFEQAIFDILGVKVKPKKDLIDRKDQMSLFKSVFGIK